VAISLSIKDCLNKIIYEKLDNVNNILIDLSLQWKDISMLGRTHGQPAIPTTVGKEIKVFQYRFNNELMKLKEIKIFAKFGGAIGNLNAHFLAYPNIDWHKWCNDFILTLGLHRSEYTTQVDNNDSLAELFDNIKRINIILIDLVQDMWQYILLNYFKLRIDDGEIGSSTMPQKVNPINFENAEGNFLLCNTLLEFISKKLPISRLQRDLTDSTISRNIGMIFGYQIVALNSLIIGLNKISINRETIYNDLESHWEILSEAIQTILRKYGYSSGYEIIKEFTHNKIINEDSMRKLIRELTINTNSEADSEFFEILLKVTPHNYIGKY
jgi:adenylosuccinate lyase